MIRSILPQKFKGSEANSIFFYSGPTTPPVLSRSKRLTLSSSCKTAPVRARLYKRLRHIPSPFHFFAKSSLLRASSSCSPRFFFSLPLDLERAPSITNADLVLFNCFRVEESEISIRRFSFVLRSSARIGFLLLQFVHCGS